MYLFWEVSGLLHCLDPTHTYSTITSELTVELFLYFIKIKINYVAIKSLGSVSWAFQSSSWFRRLWRFDSALDLMESTAELLEHVPNNKILSVSL